MISFSQLLRRLVRTKISLEYPAYPHPTHSPNRKNKYIEKKEVKKEKVFRNCNFSEGFSCRMEQSRVQIQRPEFTVEGHFYSAGLMITANTGV